MAERESFPLLGQLLLASELITVQELEQALRRQAEGEERLGQVLIEMGALAPQQLERALRAQARLRGKPEQERDFVLVVDDDPEVGAVVANILEGAGYCVGIAQTEAEAVAAAMACDSPRVALIVLDLGLPEHGGIEFLTVLRKNGATSQIPVVVLTGHAEMESEIAARGLAISAFLVKPVPARHLVQVVETAIREADERSGTPKAQGR